MTEFDAELTVVLESLQHRVGGSEDSALDSVIGAAVDWERVFELARWHGVLPLVEDGLRALGDDDRTAVVPQRVLSRLDAVSRQKTMRNLEFTNDLHEILQALAERDVRALPFKGPVLSAFAYGGLTHREFNDLDILVHPDDLSAAADALGELGYRWHVDAPRLDDAVILGGPFSAPLVQEYHMHGPGIDVELRWRVGNSHEPFPLDFETLWANSETTSVGGRQLRAFGPADRLLMLAFHGTKHGWYLLKWVCDFVEALDATTTDWERFLGRARDLGLEGPVLVGLALATELFDYDLPAVLATRLAGDGQHAPLAEQVIARFATGTPVEPDTVAATLFTLRATDTHVALLPLVLARLTLSPTQGEYCLRPLPGPFHPIYYLVRPFRLVADSISGPLQARLPRLRSDST
jgi:hypothetical protein